MPGAAGPTVPIFTRSGGLQVPAPQVSDMPHSSASGSPSAWKNSITSRGVGAAPTFSDISSSSPSAARILDPTRPSAFAYSCASSAETSSPACSARTLRSPTSMAHLVACLRSGSCSASIPASSAAFSFSQMRGTAKNQVGRTSGR